MFLVVGVDPQTKLLLMFHLEEGGALTYLDPDVLADANVCIFSRGSSHWRRVS